MAATIEAISSWQLSFVQDCNLRCRYCATGYGRYNNGRRVMSGEIWGQFCDLALSMRGAADTLHFHFSGGETFLHFDLFIKGVQEWKERCAAEGIGTRISVCTNGVLLDDERLKLCAALDLELTFSIDGPATVHDAQRLDADGHSTQATALQNWRRYRDLIAARESAGGCFVQSVVTDTGSLREIIQFWTDSDSVLFDAMVAEPSRFVRCDKGGDWNGRRRSYLDDFHHFAMTQSEMLPYPGFLSDYRGPAALYAMWSKMFLDRTEHAPCQPGRSMLAVDPEGRLYPCEGFFGHESWSLGDVTGGVCEERRKGFLEELARVRSDCAVCSVRAHCDGGCVAADPERGLVRNYENGCAFIGELVEIAVSSYRRLSRCRD